MVEKIQKEVKYKKYSEEEYLKIKKWRKNIYKETKKIALNNQYSTNNEQVNLGIPECPTDLNYFIIKPEDIYQKKDVDIFKQIEGKDLIDIKDNQYIQIGKYTKLYVINGDSFEVAMKFAQKGFSVAVLNMASDKKPGGGVENGAGAQEESLFRRSNYFQYLKKSTFYPIPISGGILSKKVKVFRAPEKENYSLLNKPFEVDCIAVPALRSPVLKKTKNGWDYSQEDKVKIRKKIETIMCLSSLAKANCVVLGAFGCGAFHNPPESVSKLFKEVIYEKFNDVFQCIAFAIIEDHNSFGNIKPFEKCFETVAIKIGDLIL